jgi:hypothetical protein
LVPYSVNAGIDVLLKGPYAKMPEGFAGFLPAADAISIALPVEIPIN